jgi:hypothetical protein
MLVRDMAYLENLDQSLSVWGGRRWRSHRSIVIAESNLQIKCSAQVLYNRALPILPIGVSLSLEDSPGLAPSTPLSEVTRSGIFKTALATAGVSQNGSSFSYSASAIAM